MSSKATHWVRAMAVVSGIFLISAPLGQAVPGAGTLGGWEKVAVKGCPNLDLLFGSETELELDGDFVSTSLFTGVVYEDLANNTIGRKVNLAPSATSLMDIVAQWEIDATSACSEVITISNATTKKLQIRFSKKGYDAAFRAEFRGNASGTTTSGRTTLRIKARGPWFPNADLY